MERVTVCTAIVSSSVVVIMRLLSVTLFLLTGTMTDAIRGLKRAEDQSDWFTENEEKENCKETRKVRQRKQGDSEWQPPKKVDKRMQIKNGGVVKHRLAQPPLIKLKAAKARPQSESNV